MLEIRQLARRKEGNYNVQENVRLQPCPIRTRKKRVQWKNENIMRGEESGSWRSVGRTTCEMIDEGLVTLLFEVRVLEPHLSRVWITAGLVSNSSLQAMRHPVPASRSPRFLPLPFSSWACHQNLTSTLSCCTSFLLELSIPLFLPLSCTSTCSSLRSIPPVHSTTLVQPPLPRW